VLNSYYIIGILVFQRTRNTKEAPLSSRDYLTPFATTNRAICEGADERQINNLISKSVTETLGIAGCLIKIRNPEDEEPSLPPQSLVFDGSSFQVSFPRGARLDLLTSYGLSHELIYSKTANSDQSMFNCLPLETVFIQDLQTLQEQGRDITLLENEGVRSLLMFSVEIRGRNEALVALFDTKRGDLSRDDVKFAKALTSRGIAEVVNQRNLEALIERKRLFLQNFQEISNAINSTLNINKVLELAVEKITEALRVKGAQIRLLDQKTQKLKLAASYGLSPEFEKIGPVRYKRGVEAEYSLNTKHSGDILVIQDVASDPRIQYQEAILAENVNKMLTMPMHVKAKNIGELTIFASGGISFSEEEIHFADTIAQQCAAAIENARLYQRVKYEYQHLLEDMGYDGSS